jgi:hypothetical protein
MTHRQRHMKKNFSGRMRLTHIERIEKNKALGYLITLIPVT